MSRTEKFMMLFLCLLVSLFIGEHIALVMDYQRNSPQVIEACPAPKPVHPMDIKP